MLSSLRFDQLFRRMSVELVDGLTRFGVTRRWALRKAEKLIYRAPPPRVEDGQTRAAGD